MLQEILPGALRANRMLVLYEADSAVDAAAQAADDENTEYLWVAPDGKISRVGGIVKPGTPGVVNNIVANNTLRTLSLLVQFPELTPNGIPKFGGDVWQNCSLRIDFMIQYTGELIGIAQPSLTSDTAPVTGTITLGVGAANLLESWPVCARVSLQNSVGSGPISYVGEGHVDLA